MNRLIAWFIKIVLDFMSWEERTRARRRDDPREARMKLLERQSVFSFLLAAGLTAVWGVMHFFGHSESKKPIIAAIDSLTQMATSALGWVALIAWIMTVVFVVMLVRYDPSQEDRWR